MPSSQSSIRFGQFELDASRGILKKHGQVVKIRNQTFDLLCYLVNNPDRAVSRTELAEHLWNTSEIDFDQRLNAAIRDLRKTLGDDGSAPQLIHTLPRKGYRFVLQAEPRESKLRTPFRLKHVMASLVVVASLGVATTWFALSLRAPLEPVSTSIHERYIEARALLDTQNPAHYDTVQELLEEVVAESAGYADAWASLANLYLCKSVTPSEALPQAKDAVGRALSINPNHVEALRHAATVAVTWDRDWGQAETYLQQALDLAPGNAEVHKAYAALLYIQGDLAAGESMMMKGLVIDPLSLVLNSDLAWYRTVSGDYEKALETCELIDAVNDSSVPASNCAVGPNLQLGRIDAAAKIVRKIVTQLGGEAQIKSLNDEEVLTFYWRKALEHQTRAEQSGYVDPVIIALMHARLGQPEDTLLALERAVNEHSDFAPYIHLFVEFRGLHSHPEYIGLLKKIGLPSTPEEILARIKYSSTAL